MGLLGAVLNDGGTLGQNGGNHDVHGSAYADHVQIHMAAGETAVGGVGADIAVQLIDTSAQGFKALDMLVNGADTEVAAAGHGHFGLTEPAQLRANEVVGSANTTHQINGRHNIPHAGAVQLQRVAGLSADGHAHVRKDLQQQAHIGNIRHVFNTAGAAHQQRRRQNGHSSVFRTGDGHGALEAFAAVDLIFDQCHSPLQYRIDAPDTVRSRERFPVLSAFPVTEKQYPHGTAGCRQAGSG